MDFEKPQQSSDQEKKSEDRVSPEQRLAAENEIKNFLTADLQQWDYDSKHLKKSPSGQLSGPSVRLKDKLEGLSSFGADDPEFLKYAKDKLLHAIARLGANARELTATKRNQEQEKKYRTILGRMRELNETITNLGIEISPEEKNDARESAENTKRYNENVAEIERKKGQEANVKDIAVLIAGERIRGANNMSVLSKILDRYGIQETRFAQNHQEFNNIVTSGVPFKIEKTANGLRLVWPGQGYDFRFGGTILNDQDAEKSARRINDLIDVAMKSAK